MEISLLRQNQLSEWDDFVKSHPLGGFMQSSFWAAFRETVGWTTEKAGLFEDGKLIGGSTIMHLKDSARNDFYYIPEGPLLPADVSGARQGFELIFGRIKDNISHETSHCRIESRYIDKPDFLNGWNESTASMEPRNSLLVDLAVGEDEILGKMKPKGRYNIRIAQKSGVTVYSGTERNELDRFIALYRETVARDGFEAKKDWYFERLLPILAKNGAGKIFIASHRDEPLAAALVVFWGDRATYFYGGSSAKDRKMMAPYLLHWEIMRYAKRNGFRLYDFWGVSPDEEKNEHPWSGISEFKRKFGGKQIDYVPTLDYVFDSGLYEEYRNRMRS